MIPILTEGIRDLSQPCSFALVLPGLLVVLSARRRRGVVVVGVLGAIWLFAWMKAAGWLPGSPNAISSAIAGLCLVGAGWAAWQLRGVTTGLAGGIVAGGIATWLWVPCVGVELAEILNAAPDEPAGQILPIGLFVLGLSVPILLVALVPIVFPKVHRYSDAIARVSLGMVVVLGIALVAGWYDDVVIQLNRWSVPSA